MSARVRTLLAVLPTVAALIAGGSWSADARAQAPSPTPPTTAANPLGKLLGGLIPTTTTVAPSPAPGAPPPAGKPGAPGAKGAPAPTTTTTRPSGPPPRIVPPEFQRLLNSLRRTPGNNTARLLDALRPLQDLGVPLQQAAIIGFGRFPVAGPASYTDDWLMPRFTPSFHLHEGTDIFAAMGMPVRAPEDGVVRFGEEPVGGKAAYVTTGDGTYYYMAHLSGFAKEVRSGSRVKQGTVVGYVGDSGNAVGGAPHLHFEIHPKGGGPVNPKPFLDRWLSEALAQVPALIASQGATAGSAPRVLTSAVTIRRFGMVPAAPPPGAGDGALPQAAGAPVPGLERVPALFNELDWEGAVEAQAQIAAWRQAQQQAQTLLAPLTPPSFIRLVAPAT